MKRFFYIILSLLFVIFIAGFFTTHDDGVKSFSDGAGMSKLKNMASFAYYNMPRHNPNLTEEQALDIAAYVTDQPRPKFGKDNEAW